MCFQRAGSLRCELTGTGPRPRAELALALGEQRATGFVLQPSSDKPSENVIALSPKYLKPLTGKKSQTPKSRRAKCSGEGQGPCAPSTKGVSVILTRQKAKGSSLANESKTCSSTPSGDVRREAAPLLTGGWTRCRRRAWFGRALRKIRK